mgnify:CR=1 FL=1
MDLIKYDVYIKTNKNNDITLITSSLIDTQGDKIKIDRGYGDKYAHAQNNYLEKELINKDGSYNYKFLNDKIIVNTELTPSPKEPVKNQQEFNMEIMLELAKIKTKLGVE